LRVAVAAELFDVLVLLADLPAERATARYRRARAGRSAWGTSFQVFCVKYGAAARGNLPPRLLTRPRAALTSRVRARTSWARLRITARSCW
jgi:hypothetical protein